MNPVINTVTGTISPDQLGMTLIHEHVFVQYGGADPAAMHPGPQREEILAVCIDSAEKVMGYGVRTLVDPTTGDLGRNVPLMAEIAARTGLNIVCATGIYSTATYLSLRERLGDGPDAVADLFIREIVEGIDGTGVKAGIIKVVTGYPVINAHEQVLLLAAAKASAETGVPVITHTEGILGDEQQKILNSAGVPFHRIVVGHSCVSTDMDYHLDIVRRGSYLGFDRFGMEGDMPDEVRVASMLKLFEAGCAQRLVVSHDSVWYWVGGPKLGAGSQPNWIPTNFFERIIPMLKRGGATDEQISTLLCDNPRRFFAAEPLPGFVEGG